MQPVNVDGLSAVIARDGSSVREIVPPGSGTGRQSLAEATVEPGAETIEHHHRRSEEIYLFTSGAGRMRIGAQTIDVAAGDAIVIPPGTPHKLWSSGREALVLLCCCSPPYSDRDTVLHE